MSDEKIPKKYLPEIEVAIFFSLIILIVLIAIIGFIVWSDYREQKLIYSSQKTSFEYHFLENQHERMQKQYTTIVSSIDNIDASINEINQICSGNGAISGANSLKVNLLRKRIQEYKINLNCRVIMLRSTFGEGICLALEKYVANLNDMQNTSCLKQPEATAKLKTSGEEIKNNLASTLKNIESKLTQILQTTPR
jgi:hypothetical protein